MNLAGRQKNLALRRVACGALAWVFVEPPFINGFTDLQSSTQPISPILPASFSFLSS
jgi:hypothetical protein